MKLLKRETKAHTDHFLLKYMITDFLEIHFSGDKILIGEILKQLLDQPNSGEAPVFTPALLLGNKLLLIQEGDPASIQELLFLNPKTERFLALKTKV